MWLRRFGRYLGEVCLQEKLPVWATILGVLIGGGLTAAGSYWIVPRINQTLEQQKIRSEFVIRNLDDLNSRTRALMADVSAIHQMLLRAGVVDDANVQKALAKITEMQWKAIELAIIFDGSTGEPIVENYQKALDVLRSALIDLRAKDDLHASQDAIEALSIRTVEIVQQLALISGLKVGKLRTPLP